jgi:hypothetical protein
MIAEVPLLDDSPSPVAVCAPHHALRNLPFQRGDGVLLAGQLDNASTLRAHVVEVQDHWIGLAAVDAGHSP